jgi:hypothetical protein
MMVLNFWSDFFEVSEPTPSKQQLYTSTQTPSASSVYILNCLFNGCTSGSNGGALSCTSVTYLLVESTSFFSCKTSGSNGGAVYFSNDGGQCVLHKVCGNDCNSGSSSNSQFSYVGVKNDASSKNYINYSSIVRCVNMGSDSWNLIYHNNGRICFPSVNVSMNVCQYFTGIYCNSFVDSNYVTGSTSYSSYTDSKASTYICFSFARSSVKVEVKCCNILRNTQGSLDSWGLIYTRGNVNFKDSCILENNVNCIFYAFTGSITLSNCTVDKTTSSGSFYIQSTVSKSFILGLNHLSTRNCNSEYDSAGYLTPIIQSPSPSKKQIYCNTCERLLNYYQQGNFVSLTSILVFNFIHFVHFR